MNTVTVINRSKRTITFIGANHRAVIYPDQAGELPETVVSKYAGLVEIVDNGNTPVKPTPKRSKSAAEDVV